MTQRTIIIGGFLLVGLALAAWFFMTVPPAYSQIKSYEECVAAGYPILESYPEQCKLPDGHTFVREIKNDFSDLIHVSAPSVNASVSSPLTITGEARGPWYFEASFPVKILDANGNILAGGPAQAQGEWMTENFVPFTIALSFTSPSTATGTVVLQNDNPSGLPENAKEIRIPVQFSPAATTTAPSVLNKTQVFKVGDKVVLSNDLTLMLKEISDSRCKPDVQCIWQGEISALFSAKIGGMDKELRLGTVNNRNVKLGQYLFVLTSATTESVTITVSSATTTGNSGIQGFIHVGPTCPVERDPPDPNCADRPYADAKVLVRSKGSNVVMSQLTSDTKGSFRAVLVPGVYTVAVSAATASALPRCETKEVTVMTNTFMNLDISCDSGIR